MRGAALPAALLCLALGLMLGFADRRARLPAILVLAVGTIATWAILSRAMPIPVPASLVEAAFLGCWASIVAIAASIYLPGGPSRRLALLLAADAALWCGAVIAMEGRAPDLLRALPWALAAVPAGWIARGRARIGLQVVTSWLIAVAILAALLPLAPTPGYAPDHME